MYLVWGWGLTFLALERILAANIETFMNILLGFLGAKVSMRACLAEMNYRKDYTVRGGYKERSLCFVL